MVRRGLEHVPIHVPGAAPRCGNCWDIPGVIRVHRSERRKAQRGPVCPYCGFRPEIVVTDDPDDRSVLPPGERFADQPNPSKFWGG